MAQLNGAQKAAVLMLVLGEDIAGELFKRLPANEVKKIAGALGRLGRLDGQTVEAVVHEFHRSLGQTKRMVSGGYEFTATALGHAFRGDPAELADKFGICEMPQLEILDRYEPGPLANFLRNEHPQTIAIIMAHLDAKKCGETFKLLPQKLHNEVIMRIANLQSVDPQLIYDIEEVLRREVESAWNGGQQNLGGAKALAKMIGKLDSASAGKMLDQLEERDPTLAEEVRGLLFVFEDLYRLADLDMQTLINAVNSELWVVALKQSSDRLREKLFHNMSSRAAKHLQEDLALPKKVRVSDVQDAQRKIVETALRLQEDGKVSLGQGDSEYV